MSKDLPYWADDFFMKITPRRTLFERMSEWWGRIKVRYRAIGQYRRLHRRFVQDAIRYVSARAEHRTSARLFKTMQDSHRAMLGARRRIRTGRG